MAEKQNVITVMEKVAIKSKSLFDHIKAVTQFQKTDYWSTLSEQDRKSWNNYMVLRFLSMEPDWVDTINEIQPLVHGLDGKLAYRLLIGIIPKSNKFLRYVKGSSTEKYEKWLIELVARHFEVSINEATDYVEIFYSTTQNRTHLHHLCKMYGTDDKLLKKLKLNGK